MAVGGGDGVNTAAAGVLHHVQKLGVDVWFALKIENEVEQFSMQFVNGFSEKILLQIARRASESPQATGTFRAAEVTGGGWFQRNGHRHPPLHGPPQPPGEVVGAENLRHVPHPPGGEFGEKIQGIVAVEFHKGKSKKVKGKSMKLTRTTFATLLFYFKLFTFSL